MQRNILLTIALLTPVFLFCQKPFAPLGAKWGGVIQCSPSFYPCPPDYPFYYTFEVTEDTVIQGKYCTLIDDSYSFNWEYTIIHQDGHQIYRYDREDETFKLALDFSKEVGESWQMEVPEDWGAGTDTLTITVLEKDSTFRRVSVSIGNTICFPDLPFYEGFGGLVHNKRLLLGLEFYIVADPTIWDELTCYIDPVEGLLYGNESGCEPVDASSREADGAAFVVYPNPASGFVMLKCPFPLAKAAEWTLSDALGRTVQRQALPPGTEQHSMPVGNLANGIYCWKVQLEGKVMGAGKVLVIW